MKPGIQTCCICGKEFTGYGHSPYPVKETDAECCNECNARVVLPKRAELSKKHEAMKTELEKIKAHIEKQTEGMDQQVREKIDELIASITGSGAAIPSFVSAENENVTAVQFVIKTPAIEKPAPEAPEPEAEVGTTFWQKLIALF